MTIMSAAGCAGRSSPPVACAIDIGSRSVELVARAGGAAQYSVFTLGYRVAYEQFFAKATDHDPTRRIPEPQSEEGSWPRRSAIRRSS